MIKVDIQMFLEWENISGKLKIISGKFQNNAINHVKHISLSHVISNLIATFLLIGINSIAIYSPYKTFWRILIISCYKELPDSLTKWLTLCRLRFIV